MAGGRHQGRRLAGAVVVLGVVLLVVVGPAGAHAQLEWTQPVTSAVLSSPPRQVVLHFGEPVEIDFGSVRVLGPDGRRVDQGGTRHPPGDDASVEISLPSGLEKGTYVVAWRVISADSHPVHGAFVFSVGTASGAPKAASLANALARQSGSAAVGVVFGLVRFAAFVGLVVLVGVAAIVVLVWPAGAATRRVGALLWWSWGTVVATSVLGVAVQGAYAAGLPFSDIVRPSLFDEVLHTRFGEVELLRFVLCIALLPALIVFRRGFAPERRPDGSGPGRRLPPGWTVYGSIVGLGLLATPGLAGHASSTGNALVGMALDLGHLVGVALWLGGLAVLAGLLLPGGPAADRPAEVGQIARRFSTYAFVAVVVIVATGVVQSLRQVGSFYALFHTPYGRTLIVKVALVVALVGAASFSRWYVGRMAAVPPPSRGGDAPSLEAIMAGQAPSTGGAPAVLTRPARRAATARYSDEAGAQWARRTVRRLRRSVLAEVVLAIAVLAVTSLLVNAAPAKQAAAQPFTHTFDVLGVQLNAVIGPARVGSDNQFHFYVLNRLGQPEGVPELDASMSLPGQGVGPIAIPLRVGGPGHYLANRVEVPLAGVWDLKLTVRTSPIDEQEVFADVPVR